MSAAEKRVECARQNRNIPAMQLALAEKTRLPRAYYGTPHAVIKIEDRRSD
jgi:hypothetical protein